MIITVGICKEIFYLANISNQKTIVTVNNSCKISMSPDSTMDIEYKGVHIWNERVNGDDSFFGIESCDNINKIIDCINNNDPSWKDKYYFNEKEQKV